MNTGYIKLHKQLTEWEWYTNIPVKTLFIHVLLKANYADKKWQGTLIKRGSFATSYKKLSQETGLSVMQVRTSISKLILTSEITQRSHNKFTVISVNNYDDYQSNNTQDNKQITKKQQTNNKQITTTNKEKEIKNIYIHIDDLNDLVLEEISAKYSVPLRAIQRKKEDLHMWLEEEQSRYKLKGKRRNLKLTLMNWVRRDIDSGKLKVEIKTELPNLPEISEEERQKNIATLAEMKSTLLGGAK